MLRSTYHVFDLYVNYMGDTVVDLWSEAVPEMEVTGKDENFELSLPVKYQGETAVIYRLEGKGPDSYNDVGREEVFIRKEELGHCHEAMAIAMTIVIGPHSVNVIQVGRADA